LTGFQKRTQNQIMYFTELWRTVLFVYNCSLSYCSQCSVLQFNHCSASLEFMQAGVRQRRDKARWLAVKCFNQSRYWFISL